MRFIGKLAVALVVSNCLPPAPASKAQSSIVPAGASFVCTPVRVWDGDGPIWCSEGPKVRIAGVVVGQVVDSQVTDAGKARLKLSINPGTPIYSNAHLVLRPVNPVN